MDLHIYYLVSTLVQGYKHLAKTLKYLGWCYMASTIERLVIYIFGHLIPIVKHRLLYIVTQQGGFD